MRSFLVATRRSEIAKSSWARCNSSLRVNIVLDCIVILVCKVSKSLSEPSTERMEEFASRHAGFFATGEKGDATGVNFENNENTTGAGVVPASTNEIMY
jgi:hypothetical protein